MTEREITHAGTVLSVVTGKVMVEISPDISCAGCQASNACNIGKSEKKILAVENPENKTYQPGTKVTVSISRRQGYLALFLGYILPLFILLASLLIAVLLSAGELFAGLISLIITALYYIALYISGKSISKKFSFRIKNIIN